LITAVLLHTDVNVFKQYWVMINISLLSRAVKSVVYLSQDTGMVSHQEVFIYLFSIKLYLLGCFLELINNVFIYF